MKHSLILVLMASSGALSSACADNSDLARIQEGGSAGVPGVGGSSGSGAGNAGGDGGSSGDGNMGGSAGSTSNGGAGGGTQPPAPALPEDAPTLDCPTVIDAALEASDPTQTGRHSRIAPVSACGTNKSFPGNAADPSNPHLFDVYRFVNSAESSACFTFTLTYGAEEEVEVDAGPVVTSDAGADAAVDASALSPGSDPEVVPPAPPPSAKYLTAHSTFYPTDLGRAHLGDVGDSLVSPQTMGITVPAGETIDVVVYAVDVAPAGVGAYTLSCSRQ